MHYTCQLHPTVMVNYEGARSHAVPFRHQSSSPRTQTERQSDTLSRISWLLPGPLLVTGVEALPWRRS